MQKSPNNPTTVSDLRERRFWQTNTQHPEQFERHVAINATPDGGHKKRVSIVLKPNESRTTHVSRPSMDLLASLESKNVILTSDNRAYRTTIRQLEEHVLTQSKEIERLEAYVLDQAREIEYQIKTLHLVMDQVNRFSSGSNRQDALTLWTDIRRIRRRSRSRSPRRPPSLSHKSQSSCNHRDYRPSEQAARQKRRQRDRRGNIRGHCVNKPEFSRDVAEAQNQRSDPDQEEMPRLESVKAL